MSEWNVCTYVCVAIGYAKKTMCNVGVCHAWDFGFKENLREKFV